MKIVTDIDIKNKTVILRCDFNVPMQNGEITDDSRIVKSLKTIEYCLSQNCKVILMSHFGKVKTVDDLKNSLKPVAKRLSQLLNSEIIFLNNNEDPALKSIIASYPAGTIFLMENTRFADLNEQRESKCDLKLAAFWASLGDIFIFEAFGAAHRSHASTGGIVQFLPTVVGLLVKKELEALQLLNNPQRPFVGIMGGSKIDDKVKLINKLLTKVDKLLIGGGLAVPFLKATGVNIRYDNQEHVDLCQQLLNNYKDKIVLPIDGVIKLENNYDELEISLITEQMQMVDIGPKTNDWFNNELLTAGLVFWNGPMGIIEANESAQGTKNLLEDLTKIKGKVIIGGGDTGVLIKATESEDLYYHVSTGGGATLNYIEDGSLPVIDLIEKKE